MVENADGAGGKRSAARVRARRAWAVALWVALAASAATAQEALPEAVDYGREGAYVGVRGIIGAETYKEEFEDAQGNTPLDTGVLAGFDLLFGYRVHPNAALELDIEYVKDQGDFALEVISVTYDVRAYAMSARRIQPYLLAGIGVIDTDKDKADFTARFGAGLDFYLIPEVALNLGISYLFPSSAPKPDHFSFAAGVMYRF